MAKATFYDLFDGRDMAFRYACDYGRKLLLQALETAAEVPGTWEERLERTIGALLDATAENPNLAELCIVHSKSLGPEHGKPYDGILTDAFAEILTEILPADPEKRVFSFSELAAAAIVSIVARWLITRDNEDLGELRGELTTIVSMPYRRDGSARA
jgi:AcrR family transcriptional regulator